MRAIFNYLIVKFSGYTLVRREELRDVVFLMREILPCGLTDDYSSDCVWRALEILTRQRLDK